ncbi:hypothetical protein DFP87_107158 [Achromobacter marplatensis]|uniref:Uncharacterized protein n=1 Tax=Achromobacter marplatensis TaxID=470868 RepID=A0ABX9GB81_9BURK|nr:hypothetical protein DFP87_107158 [Achromobacter marplatensis]CAB3675413.1 hypothetical protein LMG26219_04036 [Achromobacter marplatensis]
MAAMNIFFLAPLFKENRALRGQSAVQAATGTDWFLYLAARRVIFTHQRGRGYAFPQYLTRHGARRGSARSGLPYVHKWFTARKRP